jgi:restriction system protein
MPRKSVVEELLDGIQFLCFHLPFWVIPPLAIFAGFVTFYIIVGIFGSLLLLVSGPITLLPFFAAFIAFVLVFAAGVSGWNQRRLRKDMVAQSTSLQSIRALSWRQFEFMVGESYRQEGYQVIEQKGRADGGIDLDLRSPQGERILVQCKNWKTRKIGVTTVREMLGVLTRERANRAVIIGTGEFTEEARRWAEGQPIELIDGATLLQKINHSPMSLPAQQAVTPSNQSQTCPKCSGNLILRTARRGPNAGNQFYGCSNYPKCRYTKSV